MEIRHPNWPSQPQEVYKGKWIGWQAVTGNAATTEKEFLSFEEFVREVRAIGVNSKSYREEARKHPKWPSNPARTYKDKWTGWEVVTRTASSIETGLVGRFPTSSGKSSFESATAKIPNVVPKDSSVANKEGIFKSGGKLWGSFDAIRDLLKGLPPSTAKILLEHPDVPKRMGKTVDGESRIFYSIQDAKQRYYDKAGRDFPAHDPKK